MIKSLFSAPLLFSFLHMPYVDEVAKIEEFAASFIVSFLIIGVYMLYWIRQNE
jgi:hypothetical protein